jgi:hypothetical protein
MEMAESRGARGGRSARSGRVGSVFTFGADRCALPLSCAGLAHGADQLARGRARFNRWLG